jgi:hypothetical protein
MAQEARLRQALLAGDLGSLPELLWHPGTRPTLFRAGGVFAVGATPVEEAWRSHLRGLGASRVTRADLVGTRWSTPKEGEPMVVGWGRMAVAFGPPDGPAVEHEGACLRVWERVHHDAPYALTFDWANLPMRTGVGLPVNEEVSPIGFAEVVNLLRGLGVARSAPHEAFWTLPYEEFVAFSFALLDGEGIVRLLEPYNGADSNLVKALRDGKGIMVTLPDGTRVSRDIEPMPAGRGGKRLSPQDLARLERWIDAGMPRQALPSR